MESDWFHAYQSRAKSRGFGTALMFALWQLSGLRRGDIEQGSRTFESERRAERRRIARELHDTLLQGVQGSLLELEVLSSSLPEGARADVQKIERNLRRSVMEGRNAINALRLSGDAESDWLAAVLAMGEHAASTSDVDFSLRIKGDPWVLPRMARTELLAIIRESLRNAFAHSCARSIAVIVKFSKQGLGISVRDNGIGINAQNLQLRQQQGHWGVAGMRERTERLRGRLRMTSKPSKGTTVVLMLPRRLGRKTQSNY